MAATFILGLSLVATLLLAQCAYASNNYDMSLTSEAHVGGWSSNGNCDITDMTMRWTELMSNDGSQAWSYRNTWNYKENYAGARQKLNDFYDFFVNNQLSGEGWAITVLDGGSFGVGDGNKMVTVSLFDRNQSVKVIQGKIQFPAGSKSSSFFVNPNKGCRFQSWEENKNIGVMSIDERNKILLVNGAISYPEDYEGEPLPDVAASSLKYVALGDSFSSGEGVLPFNFATDIEGLNECHRSEAAYPYVLETRRNLNLTNFVACSGAKTNNIVSQSQWNEGEPQIAAVQQDTDVVTITIGGNDVGFNDFATACTVGIPTGLCDFGTQAYASIRNQILNDLPQKLINVYSALDQAVSDDAKVYILGYPNIAPEVMPTGPSSSCNPLNGTGQNPDPNKNNGAAVYAIQTLLNDTIEQSVALMSSPKLSYINPNSDHSPFIGHDWCALDRYFNQITLNNTVFSYHPNKKGQNAYATMAAWGMD